MAKKQADETRNEPSEAELTGGDAGAAEVQEKMDEATDQGFFGEVPDKTPNENYTVAGVTSGADTPETIEPGSEGSTKAAPEAPESPTGE